MVRWDHPRHVLMPGVNRARTGELWYSHWNRASIDFSRLIKKSATFKEATREHKDKRTDRETRGSPVCLNLTLTSEVEADKAHSIFFFFCHAKYKAGRGTTPQTESFRCMQYITSARLPSVAPDLQQPLPYPVLGC